MSKPFITIPFARADASRVVEALRAQVPAKRRDERSEEAAILANIAENITAALLEGK